MPRIIHVKDPMKNLNHKIFLGTLMALFLHIIFYTIITSHISEIPEIAFSIWLDFLIFYLLFYLLISKVKIIKGIVFLLLIFYVINAIFYLLLSPLFGSFFLSYRGFRQSIFPILFFFFAFYFCKNRKSVLSLFKITIFPSFIIGLLGIVTYLFIPRNLWIQVLLNIKAFWGKRGLTHAMGVFRMTSVIWNPLIFGLLMTMNGILSLSILLFYKSSKRINIFWTINFIISIICVLFSFSRGAWLAMLLGSIVLFIIRTFIYPNRPRNFAIYIKLIFLILLLFIGLNASKLNLGLYNDFLSTITGHISTLKFSDEVNVGRLNSFSKALEGISSKPFGYGLGSSGFASISNRVGLRETNKRGISPYPAIDANYHAIALETGIQSLFIFVCFIISYCFLILTKASLIQDSLLFSFIIGTLAIVIGFSFIASSLNLWQYPLVPYLLYSWMGVTYKVATKPMIFK